VDIEDGRTAENILIIEGYDEMVCRKETGRNARLFTNFKKTGSH
jgi:hypothetical protein